MAIEIRGKGQIVTVCSTKDEVIIAKQPLANLIIKEPKYSVDIYSCVKVVKGLPYEGEYIFTPTEEVQIIESNNYRFTENIVINPIPSNYGLITWNGTYLTIS